MIPATKNCWISPILRWYLHHDTLLAMLPATKAWWRGTASASLPANEPSCFRIQNPFTILGDKSVKLNFQLIVHKTREELCHSRSILCLLRNVIKIRRRLCHLRSIVLPFTKRTLPILPFEKYTFTRKKMTALKQLKSTWTHCTTVPRPLPEEQDSVCEIYPPPPPSPLRPSLPLFFAPPPGQWRCFSCHSFWVDVWQI